MFYASDPVTKRVLLNGYASDILLSKAMGRVGCVLFKSFAKMYVDIASSLDESGKSFHRD